MASKPTVTLTLAGDEKKLTQSADKGARAVQDMAGKVGNASADMVRDSGKAEQALKGVGDAATKLGKPVAIPVTADTGKAESALKAVDGMSPEVEVKADTAKAESAIKDLIKLPKPVKIPVEAETSKAKQALQGLGDLGTDVGDSFSGGMVSNLKSGIAGAIGGIGAMIVDKISESIASSNKLSRTLGVQFEKSVPVADLKKYADLFNENWTEELNHFLGGGRGDQNLAFLEDAGIGVDQLAEAAARAHRAFKDFAGMAANDQRALTVELAKTAAIGGIGIPEALKGASVAARTWGLSAWDSTRLVQQGFAQLDERGDDWAETLNEYSGYFHNLGLSGQDMFNIMDQGLAGNARNTDVLADAFKELGIRVLEQTPEVSDAFKGLGLDATATAQAFASGGPAAKTALDMVIDRLNAVQDPVEQNKIGVALFGTQWEDTMRRAVGSIDIIKGAANNLAGAIYAIPGSKSIAIITNVDIARGQIDKFITDQSGRTINLHVTAYGTNREEIAVRNSGAMKARARGGWLHGPGTETSDSIILAGSNNEFVTQASEAKKPLNARVLEMMNAGQDWASLVAPRVAVASAVPVPVGGGGPVQIRVVVTGNGGLYESVQKGIRDGEIQIKGVNV